MGEILAIPKPKIQHKHQQIPADAVLTHNFRAETAIDPSLVEITETHQPFLRRTEETTIFPVDSVTHVKHI